MLGGSAAHSIDDFVMTPCTSYFDFDPELACMMAAGFEPFTALPLTRYDLIKDIRAMADVRSEEVRPAVGEDDLAAGPPWPGATAFLPHSERARFGHGLPSRRGLQRAFWSLSGPLFPRRSAIPRN